MPVLSSYGGRRGLMILNPNLLLMLHLQSVKGSVKRCLWANSDLESCKNEKKNDTNETSHFHKSFYIHPSVFPSHPFCLQWHLFFHTVLLTFQRWTVSCCLEQPFLEITSTWSRLPNLESIASVQLILRSFLGMCVWYVQLAFFLNAPVPSLLNYHCTMMSVVTNTDWRISFLTMDRWSAALKRDILLIISPSTVALCCDFFLFFKSQYFRMMFINQSQRDSHSYWSEVFYEASLA